VTFTIPKSYYVYTIKIDGVAKYVGMGSKLRAWDYASTKNDKRNRFIRSAISQGLKITVGILAEGLSRSDALRKERFSNS
jgi:hypothetical protein